MLKSIALRSALVLSALAAAPLGCAAHHDAPAAEANGNVTVALSAYGNDGAKYTLGNSVGLSLNSPSNPSFGGWGISLSGDQSSLTFQVPTGTYEASLYGGVTNGGATTFDVVRTLSDGTQTSVHATLIDTNDYKFQVFTNQVTALVFHFSVPGLGDLTFSTGSLQLGVSVGVTQGSGSSGVEFIDGTVSSQNLGTNAAVNAVIAAPVGAAAPLRVEATFTGPWGAELNSVCAPTKAHVTTTSTNPAIIAMAAELDGGEGQMCVGDAQSSSFISVSRGGTPVTAALASAIPGGASFQGAFYFTPPTPIYDNHTFSPERLDPPVAVPYAYAYMSIFGLADSTVTSSTNITGGPASTVGITP
jgi:hypothetical protein